MHFTAQRLGVISDLMKKMSEPRIVRDQPDAPAAGTGDANRTRIVSQTGGTNLFRGVVGPNSKPVGSIERGHVFPVFVPAPGVAFTCDELSQIAGLLRQAEATRS
jgi:hypothetical protein